MNSIEGTVSHGQIVLDAPVDWPEGCRVRIEPLATEGLNGGAGEEPESPEAIAEWLRWYDSLEPLEFTPEEEADLAAWRQRVKEYTIANMHKRVGDLFE
jgi:hypothetical protein